MEFDEIYNQYFDKIYRVCLGYLNDTERAKDLAQETFITVWKKQNTFRKESGIGTWIYRIATNKCLRSIENDKKRINTKNLVYHQDGFTSVDDKDYKLTFLRNIVAQLPELERIIITLVLEDVKQEKIAEIVGLSHSNIRVKVHRIKQKITKEFNKYGKF